MRTKISKKELIEKLKSNARGHRLLWEKAFTGYQRDAIASLERNIEKIKAGSRDRFFFGESPPEDHSKDYLTVISMLEMSVEDAISLDDAEYAMYVLDDWKWKPSWITSNSKYTS